MTPNKTTPPHGLRCLSPLTIMVGAMFSATAAAQECEITLSQPADPNATIIEWAVAGAPWDQSSLLVSVPDAEGLTVTVDLRIFFDDAGDELNLGEWSVDPLGMIEVPITLDPAFVWDPEQALRLSTLSAVVTIRSDLTSASSTRLAPFLRVVFPDGEAAGWVMDDALMAVYAPTGVLPEAEIDGQGWESGGEVAP